MDSNPNSNLKTVCIELFKYFWVALLSAALDFSVFVLFYDTFGVSYIVSNTIAFILGVSVNYTLSTKFVFKCEAKKNFREFFIFVIIGIIGLGISHLSLFFMIDVLQIAEILKNISPSYESFTGSFAKIFAIGTTFIWNFSARKIILFNSKTNVKRLS